MGIVDDIVHRIGQDVRMDARKMLVPALLVLAGGLTGAAGVGFLTTWAYLTLSVAVGYGPAALLTGLGFTVLSVGLLSLARNRLSKHELADPSVTQPKAPANDSADVASQIAFTAAFVLARHLGKGKRD
ncbi:MAG: phage holin family protein [Yoonia sp.]